MDKIYLYFRFDKVLAPKMENASIKLLNLSDNSIMKEYNATKYCVNIASPGLFKGDPIAKTYCIDIDEKETDEWYGNGIVVALVSEDGNEFIIPFAIEYPSRFNLVYEDKHDVNGSVNYASISQDPDSHKFNTLLMFSLYLIDNKLM